MSAVCPKCGVAVVPGYVKCPKCQAPLPLRRASTQAAGGTSMGSGGGLSLGMIIGGLVVIGAIVTVFALRGGNDKAPTAEIRPDPEPAETIPAVRAAPSDPDVTPTQAQVQPAATDPTVAVRDLDRALTKERLWGTVEVVGGGAVDVRSGACRDAAMMPLLEASIPALKEGGVTKLRCLEQAGAVVFERDL